MSETSMRAKLKTIMITALIGFLVMAMAIWGVTDVFSSSGRNAAAIVGKEKIDIYDFDNRFKDRLSQVNQSLPERLTYEQAYQRGLHRDVVNAMVTDKLIEIDADDLGVGVNSRDAKEYIVGLDVFNNDISGEFDENKLRRSIAQRRDGMTRKKYDDMLYNDLRAQQSLPAIPAGLVVPSLFTTSYNNFQTEQRTVKILIVGAEAITTPEDPSDEVLQAYVDDNAARYTAPEYRRFTMMRIETVDLLRDIEISEEDVQKRFDYKIKVGQLGSIETRSMINFVSGSQAEADAITAALNAGQTTEIIMANLGADAPEVYTDILATGTTDPNTGEAAYGLKEGAALTVAGSLGNWNSVKVTGITAAVVPDIESERASITLELKTESAQRSVFEVFDSIQSSLDDGISIEDIGQQQELSVASFDLVSRLGQFENGARFVGDDGRASISDDDKILTEIFVSGEGYEGNAFETASKGIASVRVDEIVESARKPFADIREQALKDWHIVQADEALGALMNDLAERSIAGESMDDIAKTYDEGVVATEVTISRSMNIPGLGEQVTVKIFDARSGQTVRGKSANGFDRIVAKVTTITPNQDMIAGSAAAAMEAVLAKSIQADIENAYRAAVLAENPLRMVESNIIQVLGIKTQ